MSRDGNGNYSLPLADRVDGTTIEASWANTTLDDLATALTNSLAKDGQTVLTGDLDFNGNSIILDLDGDTSITADTDDRIDVEIGGSDLLQLTGSSDVLVFTNPQTNKGFSFVPNGTGTFAITGSADITGDLDVDNININDNTIISTDTDGDINLNPNGTGTIELQAATNVTGAFAATGAITTGGNTVLDSTDLAANGGSIPETDRSNAFAGDQAINGATGPAGTSVDDLVIGNGSSSRGVVLIPGNTSLARIAVLNSAKTSLVGYLEYDRSESFGTWNISSNNGLVIDSATGGGQGSGTINAEGVYVNGSAVTTLAFKDVASDSGTAVADSNSDTLTITGAGSITTSVSGDTLTITDGGSSGTFTPTWSGFSSAPVGDINYSVSGGYCTLWVEANRFGTSNATNMSITNLPAACQPASHNKYGVCSRLRDNSSSNLLGQFFAGSSTLAFAILKNNTGSAGGVISSTTFTNSNEKGLVDGWSITYSLA